MTTTFTIRELTASEITESALLELSARGCEAWRQNNIAVRGRTFTGKKGLPDITGYVKSTGVSVYCETKKIGDSIKPEQVDFLTKAYKSGCVVLIATQVKNEVKLLSIPELLKGLHQELNHIKKMAKEFQKIEA